MEPSELKYRVRQINDKLMQGRVPALDDDQLSKLIEKTVVSCNGSIEVILGFPVVSIDVFSKYFVFPVPDTTTRKIPHVVKSTIMINQQLHEYLDDITDTPINLTLAITNTAMQVHHKANELSDCEYKSILLGDDFCSVVNLPATYDNWVSTPVHNGLAFFSNQKNFMVCNNIRTRITAKAGLREVPLGCYVDTISKRILATQDTAAISKKVFKLDIKETLYVPMRYEALDMVTVFALISFAANIVAAAAWIIRGRGLPSGRIVSSEVSPTTAAEVADSETLTHLKIPDNPLIKDSLKLESNSVKLERWIPVEYGGPATSRPLGPQHSTV